MHYQAKHHFYTNVIPFINYLFHIKIPISYFQCIQAFLLTEEKAIYKPAIR